MTLKVQEKSNGKCGDKMIIKRNRINALYSLFEKKGKINFSIETQYKIIKIKKLISEELDIYTQQVQSLSDYFEKDEKGEIIKISDGVKIKSEYIEECAKKIYELDNSTIQLPDIYFSLDELEPLNLTLDELELLEPFIKI